jgi:hypothetical protein
MTIPRHHDPEAAEFDRQVESAAATLPRAPSARRYRQILVAYNGSEQSIAALERVAAIAAHDSESRSSR